MAKVAFYQNKRFQIQLYSILSVILILVIGYYTINNTMKMLDMRGKSKANDQLHSALTEADTRLDDELVAVKDDNAELFLQIQNELTQVFPEGENHTSLTRSIEGFANDINRSKDPFIINKLQYLKPKDVEGEYYTILPITMTIHSSYDNFFRFLEFTENSGTLKDKTRVLDIKSIVINFVSPSGSQGNTSGEDEINFNVSMYSFFRPTQQTQQ